MSLFRAKYAMKFDCLYFLFSQFAIARRAGSFRVKATRSIDDSDSAISAHISHIPDSWCKKTWIRKDINTQYAYAFAAEDLTHYASEND